jgi:DNA transformation protein and related proteins
MAVKDDYLQWVVEQVSGAGKISSRRMFGAVGLYSGGVFFAIVSGDTLYFKVNDATRCHYEKRGMSRFRPYHDKPLVSMNYYEVPADVLEDPEECVEWALRAVSAAVAKPKSPTPKPVDRRRQRATRP